MHAMPKTHPLQEKWSHRSKREQNQGTLSELCSAFKLQVLGDFSVAQGHIRNLLHIKQLQILVVARGRDKSKLS